jgi:hypothetical protein
METKYNGWTNYATWRVNLELCEGILESASRDRCPRFTDAGDLADWLKDQVDDVLTDFGTREEGIALDYARSFVSDVNWYEIASHYDGLIATDNEDEEDTEEDLALADEKAQERRYNV